MPGQGGGDDEVGKAGRVPLAPTIRPDQAAQIGQLVAGRRAKPRKGSLLVIAGAPADIGTHWVVEGVAVIGRDPEGLALRDGQASRQHLSVTGHEDRYFANDLGSTNGTLLNGAPLTSERPLADGDKITIGQTVIKFTLVDATEASYLQRMALLAGTDELTGLLAKHRFDSLLAEAFRNARQMAIPLSLMMMDLDGLKAINDRHGHQLGAYTISQVGRMIGQIVAHRGEACRFGGDEYSAMFPGVQRAAAMQVGEQIRQAVLGATFRLGAIEVRATISIGVAEVTDKIDSVEALVAEADRALYRAKQQGRNIVAD